MNGLFLYPCEQHFTMVVRNTLSKPHSVLLIRFLDLILLCSCSPKKEYVDICKISPRFLENDWVGEVLDLLESFYRKDLRSDLQEERRCHAVSFFQCSPY